LRLRKRPRKVRSNYVVFDEDYGEWDPTPDWSAPGFDSDPDSDLEPHSEGTVFSDTDTETVVDWQEVMDKIDTKEFDERLEGGQREMPKPTAPFKGVTFNPVVQQQIIAPPPPLQSKKDLEYVNQAKSILQRLQDEQRRTLPPASVPEDERPLTGRPGATQFFAYSDSSEPKHSISRRAEESMGYWEDPLRRGSTQDAGNLGPPRQSLPSGIPTQHTSGQGAQEFPPGLNPASAPPQLEETVRPTVELDQRKPTAWSIPSTGSGTTSTDGASHNQPGHRPRRLSRTTEETEEKRKTRAQTREEEEREQTGLSVFVPPTKDSDSASLRDLADHWVRDKRWLEQLRTAGRTVPERHTAELRRRRIVILAAAKNTRTKLPEEFLQ